MKPEVMLELLENAAEQLGIRVSYEALQSMGTKSTGGLCRVKGEYRIIADKRATAEERVVTLASSLGQFELAKPGFLDELELPNKVREVLRTYEPSKSSKPGSTRAA
jgi:hypothetical protein